MKQQYGHHFFLLELLIYSVCFLLFIGLVFTVGMNMLVSQVFASSMGDVPYTQPYVQVTSILFWSATGMLFFFGAVSSTLLRCLPRLSSDNTLRSKTAISAHFCRMFFRQWGLVLLLIVVVWMSGKTVINHVVTSMTSHMQQSQEQQPNTIKYLPAATHES